MIFDDCPKPPVIVQKFAGHGLYTHIRRLKDICLPPLSADTETFQSMSQVEGPPAEEEGAGGGPRTSEPVPGGGGEEESHPAPAAVPPPIAFPPFYGPPVYRHTFTPVTSPAPEPQTWAMLIAGLLIVTTIARKRTHS